MNPVAESSSGVIAILLDDLAPPRLGTMLRAARKQTGATRREIAQRVGTTPNELRRYERGDAPVPPHLIASFAECYGDDLTGQLATRAPIQVDGHRLVVGTDERPLETDDSEELLGHYVGIVSRLRQAQPGEPIALRADDLVALSNALGQDPGHVEARIVELLGCTPVEARSLHAEMLRRKLVLPVAGLVAGIAMVAGVGMGIAQASPAQHSPAPTAPAASESSTQVAAAHITAGHIAAGNVVTEVVAEPTTVVVKPAAPTTPTTVAPETDSPTTTAPVADAPAPEPPATVEPTTAEAPATAPPVITPDTTPMGIPPNETVTIIAP